MYWSTLFVWLRQNIKDEKRTINYNEPSYRREYCASNFKCAFIFRRMLCVKTFRCVKYILKLPKYDDIKQKKGEHHKHFLAYSNKINHKNYLYN